VYRWELNGPAQQEFAGLRPGRASIPGRRDERDDVSMPLRSLHFGPDGGGLVRFLVYPPDDLVLVVHPWHDSVVSVQVVRPER
jgi:hypothetical protein